MGHQALKPTDPSRADAIQGPEEGVGCGVLKGTWVKQATNPEEQKLGGESLPHPPAVYKWLPPLHELAQYCCISTKHKLTAFTMVSWGHLGTPEDWSWLCPSV
jgi:hypothetical protein